MFRQSPRKNGRNKGVKVKHVVQISLLLGVSIWLLYQVHHSDDKKVSVATNVNKLRNVSLGRKFLRPKVKETDRGHESDEQGIEKEDEEVFDHETESGEREDMKHEKVGEKELVDDHESDEKDDGGVKTTRKGGNNGDTWRGRSVVKVQTEGEGKHKEDRGSKKEEKGSGKGGEKEQGNNVNKNVQLRSKEIKKKDEGGKKEMKQVYKSDMKVHKQSDGAEEIRGNMEQNKGPHPKEIQMSVSSEDHDQSVRDQIDNVEDKTIPDSYPTSSMKDSSDIEGQDKEQISNDDVSVGA